MAKNLPEMVETFKHKTTEQTFTIVASLDSIEATISSRKQLKQILEELTRIITRRQDPESRLRRYMPEAFDESLPHRLVPITWKETCGAREDVAALLATISPGLANPIQRIGERLPLNKEIASQIGKMSLERYNLLEEGLRRTSSKSFRGPRGYFKGGGYPEADRESFAEIFFAPQVISKSKWTGSVLNEAFLESGLPLFNTQLFLTHEDWYLKMEGKLDLDEFYELFSWQVFDFYVALFGETDLADQVHALLPKDTPRLRDALDLLDLEPDKRNRIIGDIAIIQYVAFKKPTVLPGVSTRDQLFAELGRLSYPRLSESTDKNPQQRMAKIIKAMAVPLESAKIVQIDWGPLLDAVHFRQKRT